MTTQPEALRLAEYHECAEDLHSIQTAAELRRLADVEAQRDALLEALRPFAAINASIGFTYKDVDRARAAIKAVEEKA